jgi:hypothetical protein
MPNFKINDGRKQGDFGKDMKPGYDYREGVMSEMPDGYDTALIAKTPSHGMSEIDGSFDNKHAYDHTLIKKYPPMEMGGLVT